MGVYIKGMEMPTRCIACQLNHDSFACIVTGSRFYKYDMEFDPSEERLSDCPLVPVPPHGRLIDADVLQKDGWAMQRTYQSAPSEMTVEMKRPVDFPTIIPEEGE